MWGCHTEPVGEPMETPSRRPGEGPTLSFLATKYLTDRYRRGELSKDSLRTYRSTLDRFVNHLGRDGTCRRITRQSIEEWATRDGLAASTRRSQLATIKAWCQWLVYSGYMRTDPSTGVKGPRQPRLL